MTNAYQRMQRIKEELEKNSFDAYGKYDSSTLLRLYDNAIDETSQRYEQRLDTRKSARQAQLIRIELVKRLEQNDGDR